MTQTYEKGKLYDLSIIDLKPDPNQPRKSIDLQALEDLAASVKLKGIIQPLLFRVDAQSPYLLIVAGERRFKAAQMANLPSVPGLCVEGNAAEIALIENVQRQDLTCIEEAEALKKLMDEEKYTQDQLAVVIGKPRTTITESLSLTNLPQAVRDECRGDRTVSKARLVEIARKKQQRAMSTAYDKYREELQKALEGGTKKREKLTAAAIFCQSLDKTRERLEKTDISDWSDAGLLAANASVTALQEALGVFINPPVEGGEVPPSRELA
ncbi:MAG: ParB/RepB/Spo0J family partition protein [Syntrophus sp. (in: bacteria)]